MRYVRFQSKWIVHFAIVGLFASCGAAQADVANGIATWATAMSAERSPPEAFDTAEGGIGGDKLVARIFEHQCFSFIQSAKLTDLDFARTSLIDGTAMSIPCRDGLECVTIEYGNVWRSVEGCSELVVAQEPHADFLLLDIGTTAAQAAVEAFRDE